MSLGSGEAVTASEPRRSHLALDPTSCAVLVQARSNVGKVSFGTTDVTGTVDAVVLDDQVLTDDPPSACLELPLASLTSGNALYDAELHQRLAVQRYPTATVALRTTATRGQGDYSVTGDVTLHGVTVGLEGTVLLSMPTPGTMVISGEQNVDIRDFDIDVPSLLMLRIYPDVKVSLRLLARQQT